MGCPIRNGSNTIQLLIRGSRHRDTLTPEEFRDSLVPVIEDPIQRAADEKGPGDRSDGAERHPVFDVVFHLGPARHVFEAMC